MARLDKHKAKAESSQTAGGVALRLTPEGRIASFDGAAQSALGAGLSEQRMLSDYFPAAGAALRAGLTAAPRQAFCVAPLGARQGEALALLCQPLVDGDWQGALVPLVGGSGREAEILSDLLHDLRTPLTTLLGAAELLDTGRLGALPERAAGLLKVAASAATQITGMLDKAAERRDAPEER